MTSNVSTFTSVKISDEDARSHKQYYLGLLLVEEAKKRGTTTEKWMLISDLFVANLVDIDGLRGISQTTKLAIAIVIVGSEDYFYFYLTLKIICDYGTSNIYCDLQEQLLALYCLYLIRNAFENYEEDAAGRCQLNSDLLHVMPHVAPSWTASRESYDVLRGNIFTISNEFGNGAKMWEHYEVVELEYPFQKFKLRFVKWAQKKLESVSSAMNEASHRDQEVSFKQVKKRKVMFLSYKDVDTLLSDLK